jgi:hypothetical protein
MRTILFLTAIMTVCAGAQSGKPDFSGRWQLDLSRSKAPVELPAMEQVIDHRGSAFRWTTKITTNDGGAMLPPFLMGIADPQGELTIDGKETVRTSGPFERRSRSEWDGQHLVTLWNVKTPQDPPHGKSIRSLSADGKTQTVDIEMESAMMGTIHVQMVFSKK